MSFATRVNAASHFVDPHVDPQPTFTKNTAHANERLNLAQNQHTPTTDWHAPARLPLDQNPSSSSSLSGKLEGWVNTAAYSAALHPVAPLALAQQLMGGDQISEFAAAVLAGDGPSIPQLVANAQELGRDAINGFLKTTGHVSHIPEEPIHVADSASAALKGSGFDGLLGATILTLSARKGGGLGDITGTLGITQGRKKGLSTKNQQPRPTEALQSKLNALGTRHEQAIRNFKNFMLQPEQEIIALGANYSKQATALQARIENIQREYPIPAQPNKPTAKNRQELLDVLTVLKARGEAMIQYQKALGDTAHPLIELRSKAQTHYWNLRSEGASAEAVGAAENAWKTLMATTQSNGKSFLMLEKKRSALERRISGIEAQLDALSKEAKTKRLRKK